MFVQVVANRTGEARLEAGAGELECAAHVDKGPGPQLPVHLPAQPQAVAHIQVNLLPQNGLYYLEQDG